MKNVLIIFYVCALALGIAAFPAAAQNIKAGQELNGNSTSATIGGGVTVITEGRNTGTEVLIGSIDSRSAIENRADLRVRIGEDVFIRNNKGSSGYEKTRIVIGGVAESQN